MTKMLFGKFMLVAALAAIFVCGAFGISTLAQAGDALNDGAPVIISQNVEYGDDYALMYAVLAESITSESFNFEVFENADCAGTPIFEKTVSVSTARKQIIKGEECYVVFGQGIVAKKMDVQYYVKITSGTGVTVKRYSVAEYFYERLYKNGVAFGTSNGDIARARLYNSALVYGANAQDVLYNYNTDENGEFITSDDRTTFVTDTKYVYVKDGVGRVDEVFKSGIFLPGDNITLHTDDLEIKIWRLYDLTTKEFIAEISAGESFSVTTHTVAEAAYAPLVTTGRGSGKYASHQNAISYTDTTHEALISAGLMNKNTLRKLNGKTLTFDDGAMQLTSNSATQWAAVNYVKQGESANIVFETDIKLDGVKIDPERYSSFEGTSTNGSRAADLTGITVKIYSNPDTSTGGYIFYVMGDVISGNAETVIPEGEWVNIRYEADGFGVGSTARFIVDGETAVTVTLTDSIENIVGIEFVHMKNEEPYVGFCEGTFSLDNTYCGIKE